MAHRTQFPEDIERISKLSDEQLEKLMNDPNTAWWSEPLTLIFGKSVVGGSQRTMCSRTSMRSPPRETVSRGEALGEARLREASARGIGGTVEVLCGVLSAHGLEHLPDAEGSGDCREGRNDASDSDRDSSRFSDRSASTLKVKAPDGWKVTHGDGTIRVAGGSFHRAAR